MSIVRFLGHQIIYNKSIRHKVMKKKKINKLEEGRMINFSIFIFIIYAVYESAANIVFGSGRKKYRRHRRRRAYAVAAKHKRAQQTVLYTPKKTDTQKRGSRKAPRLLFYYCSMATIA